MKKINCLLVLVALAIFITNCNQTPANSNTVEEKAAENLSPADTLSIIPMKIQQWTIYIPCSINGTQKEFVLDAEWKYHCIESKYIQGLFDTTGHTITSNANGFKTVLCNKQINFSFPNQTIKVDTIELLMHKEPDGFGIIGSPLFDTSVVCLNFDNKKMYLTNKVPNDIEDYEELDYVINTKDHRVVSLAFPSAEGQKVVKMLVDFGSPFSNLENHLKKIIAIDENKEDSLDLASILMSRSASIHYRRETTWTNSQNGQTDNPFERWGCNGVIGMDIISQYNWIVDYKHNKLYYCPNGIYRENSHK